MPKSARITTLVLLAASLTLLLPGIFSPVLTIRGVLTKDGIAYVTPLMLDKGLNEDTMATLKTLINPQMISMIEVFGGDLRKMIIDKLSPQLSAALQQDVGDIEVYQQTRSIMGSVRQLYAVGSPLPATLILLFSVVVPLTKAAMVGMAVHMRSSTARVRTLRTVETIAKWSMADVFAVALLIVFL
ncbi:MAG: paraquat-inducible protein A, partial [Acidobacteria bacterium]|nr:paraquat-inducible protein A [Acidobacteriota bacterium]